jgi:hypothetical protein
MLVVITPMAACYPAITLGLDSAPPLRFGGLALLLVLVIRRKPLWPEARLAGWILPLALKRQTGSKREPTKQCEDRSEKSATTRTGKRHDHE